MQSLVIFRKQETKKSLLDVWFLVSKGTRESLKFGNSTKANMVICSVNEAWDLYDIQIWLG